jgi:hypothetical protein
MVLLFFAIHWFRNQNVQRDIGEYALGLRTKDFGCKVNGPYQDKACTPGAVFPQATVDQICVRGYAHSVRDVPYEVKKQAYEEYGVYHRYKGEYEVDHLVSLELGGSNDIANLWPEAADPRPGFHEKDKVENYLHQEVCAGRIPLKKAQWLIADDWMKVYNQL